MTPTRAETSKQIEVWKVIDRLYKLRINMAIYLRDSLEIMTNLADEDSVLQAMDEMMAVRKDAIAKFEDYNIKNEEKSALMQVLYSTDSFALGRYLNRSPEDIAAILNKSDIVGLSDGEFSEDIRLLEDNPELFCVTQAEGPITTSTTLYFLSEVQSTDRTHPIMMRYRKLQDEIEYRNRI